MKLNKAGYSAGNDDGIWGHETKQALRNYQQEKKLPGNGEPNQQTLAELGVNTSGQVQSGNRTGRNSEQMEHQTTGSAAGNATNSSATNRGNTPQNKGSGPGENQHQK
jgi:peptidoglycan hydrolase-like protein with peptidoglycan-binding domain